MTIIATPVQNKSGKFEKTINWKEFEKYSDWLKNIGPFSNNYTLFIKEVIQQYEPIILKVTAEDSGGELEDYYESLHVYPGNGGTPEFSKSGIYNDKTIWEIENDTNDIANVNVTFKMPAGWYPIIGGLKIKMVKENGVWKLAAPVEEGKISSLFGK